MGSSRVAADDRAGGGAAGIPVPARRASVEPGAAGARIRPGRERTDLVDLPLFTRRDPPHQPPPSTLRCDAVGDHFGLSNGRAAGHRVRLFRGHGRIRHGPVDSRPLVPVAFLSGGLFLSCTRWGRDRQRGPRLWPDSATTDRCVVAFLRSPPSLHNGPRSLQRGGGRELYVSVPEAADPVPTRLVGP